MNEKKLIIILIVLALFSYLIFIFFSKEKITIKPKFNSVHFYKNPSIKIDKIYLKVFYVIPKEKTINKNWKAIIEKSLEEISKFHFIQFRGFSSIIYQIYPKPIILEKDSQFYDINTSKGNPQALILISEELKKRVFSINGDLYLKDFLDKNNYNILVVIYEGIGASGGIIAEKVDETDLEKHIFPIDIESFNGLMLISFDYLNNENLKKYGNSIFYHELAHTLGIEDKYDENNSFSDDIMGLGRFRSISINYLNEDVLKNMGIIK